MSQPTFDIQRLARLARLQLTEEEARSYEQQISRVLDYMSILEGHEIAGVEPTAHAFPVEDVWREDAVVEGLSTEAALSNAPAQRLGQFLMPCVVEK